MSNTHPNKENQQTKDWKLIERVVALLEETLDPNASINVNEYLPELATGTMRQCDVVIRTGKPPRDTLTIVEVQDRNRKVEYATYEGWCKKREKLGAQQLICVSRVGFPASIHKDAVLRGHTVRLVTLLEVEDPPDFITIRTVISNMQILEKREGEVIFTEAPHNLLEESFRISDRIFRSEMYEGLRSLSEIAELMLKRGAAKKLTSVRMGAGRYQESYLLDFEEVGNLTWLSHSDYLVPVSGARIVDTLERITRTLPIQILAYEQTDFNGALAWIVIAKGDYEGKEHHIRIPYVSKEGKPVWTGRIMSSKIPGLVYESEVIEIGYRVVD